MVTPLDSTEQATSISREPRVTNTGSVPAITDKQITSKELWEVKQHLLPFSTKWHDIGLILRLPKGKLNEIDADYSCTSRKLTEIIDAWITRGEGCTWERLHTALQVFSHLENTKTTVTPALEANPHLKDSKIEQCMKFREDEQKSRRKIELAFYHLRCVMAEESYMIHLKELRECLIVPDSVPHESMLKNIKLYLPLTSLTPHCSMESLVLGNITAELQQERMCLEKWVDFLLTDTKSVSNLVQNLTAKKENIKEVLFEQEVQKPGCHTAGTSQFTTQCSNTMARDLQYNMEKAKSYQTTLHNGLGTCLNQVDSTIKKNGSLKLAINSIKTTMKGVLYFRVYTVFFFLVLFLILFKIFQIKFVVLVVMLFLITSGAVIAYLGFPSIRLIMKKGLYKILTLGTSGGLILCSLAGAVGSMIMKETSAGSQSVPTSSLEFNSNNITYTKSVMLYYTTTINDADPILRHVPAILLISLPILVLKDLIYHTKGYSGALAFILFMILLPSVESFEIILAPFGLLHGIMGDSNSILHDIMYGYGVCFYSVAWTAGTMISEYTVGVIFQQPELTSWSPAIGGALGTVCLLQLNTYIQYKYTVSNSPISQSTQILEENEHKLNIIRNRIKKLF